MGKGISIAVCGLMTSDKRIEFERAPPPLPATMNAQTLVSSSASSCTSFERDRQAGSREAPAGLRANQPYRRFAVCLWRTKGIRILIIGRI